MLYKTFTAWIGIETPKYPEEKMVSFVRDILEALEKKYPISYNRRGEMDYSKIQKAFTSICIRLEKKLSVPAKIMMLDGKISAL